jgi:hypothetical protein
MVLVFMCLSWLAVVVLVLEVIQMRLVILLAVAVAVVAQYLALTGMDQLLSALLEETAVFGQVDMPTLDQHQLSVMVEVLLLLPVAGLERQTTLAPGRHLVALYPSTQVL